MAEFITHPTSQLKHIFKNKLDRSSTVSNLCPDMGAYQSLAKVRYNALLLVLTLLKVQYNTIQYNTSGLDSLKVQYNTILTIIRNIR